MKHALTHSLTHARTHAHTHTHTHTYTQHSYIYRRPHRNNFKKLGARLYFKIHVPTDAIPPPALTTIMRSSHERNILVPYARTDVRIQIFILPTPAQLLYGIIYTKQSKKLNHWIFKSRL